MVYVNLLFAEAMDSHDRDSKVKCLHFDKTSAVLVVFSLILRHATVKFILMYSPIDKYKLLFATRAMGPYKQNKHQKTH